MKYNYFEEKNYNLHNIDINKFKTIQIDLKFIERVSRENITKRSLLPYVLKAGCKKYPSKMEIRLKLEEMYGTNLYVNSTKRGDLSIVTISLSFVNEKYIHESLNKQIVDFINELLFNPLVKNDSFDEDIFNEEVRLLKDEFIAIVDNKSKYVSKMLFDEMFKDENYKYSSLGVLEDLDKITAKSLYEYYLEFLKNDLEIIINGQDNNLSELIKELPFKNEKSNINPIDYQTKEIKEVKRVTEIQKIRQAKLALGYRCEIRTDNKLRYPMTLLSCILGGYPHSKLFRIVREKNSLAYSIYSRYDSYKGVLFINAGIDNDKLDKTIDLINQCVLDMTNNITNEEFEMTKISLINDYLEMLDSQTSISTKAFLMSISGEKFDLNKTIEEIKNVKIEDIYEASKSIKLDTIAFLGCDENE